MTKVSRRDLLAFLLVLIVAAILRFQQSDVVEYFHDDAMLSTLSLELVSNRRLPLTGILSSTGIPNSPASVYVLAIPFSLSSDPMFAVHFVMLLNVLGVGLLWLLARWQFGPRAALITGLLYAVNPWAILFSRKIWAQELHTPLILLGILLLVYGFWSDQDRRRNRALRFIAQCLSMPLLLFALQIHFAALALLPILALMLWRGRRQIIWKAFGLSVLLSILVLLPYALGLLRTLDLDPDRISDAAKRAADDGLGFSTEPIQDILFLASGYGTETWLAPDQQGLLTGQLSRLRHLSIALLLPLFLGAIASIRNARSWKSILMLWAFLPSLLLLIEWTPAYIHYFIPSIPALALLTGLGFDYVMTKSAKMRLAQLAISLALLLILLIQIMSLQVSLSFVAAQHIPYPGFTSPLRSLNPLRAPLRNAEDVLVISQGMSWNLHHEVAVWETLLWDDVGCVRTMRADGYAVFPRHAFSVVVAPDAQSKPARNLYATEMPEVFRMRKGGADYEVHEWESAPSWNGAPIVTIDPGQFDNGVQLTGYSFAGDELVLAWKLPERQAGLDYQYSAQLFDDNGERVGQLDATFWHGRHWCAGDRLITWGPLSASGESTLLKVAMYRLGVGKDQGLFFSADVLDELGNPMGQAVDIRI